LFSDDALVVVCCLAFLYVIMPSAPHEPRNLLRLWICVVVGIAIWFSPAPAELNAPAWHIFAVFAATILSFLLRPLPMGVCVLLGLCILACSGALADPNEHITLREQLDQWEAAWMANGSNDFKPAQPPLSSDLLKNSFAQSLSGFANTTTWLVVAAFLIAGAMIRTGLGRRIALTLISRLGSTTLGLGYAIAAAEFVLGPFVPSNTARGGGVMAPIVDSLSRAMGSRPDEQPQQAGQYLALVGAHANLIVAAMFLTGMAANPLVADAADKVLEVKFDWFTWLLGSIVPGLVSLIALPLVMRWLAKPRSAGSAAQDEARQEIAAMGGWTAKQIMLGFVLAGMVTLWATAPLQKAQFGFALPTALVALGGVVLLVVLGVEQWKDVVGNSAAWDTLIWLGGLITMSNALNDSGFTSWFAESIGGYMTGWPAVATALGLAFVYFYSMYAFSMLTGHILAMAGVFFAVGAAAGAPPMLLVPLVAYFSNLCGCLTNYSSGPIVIYYGLGYVPVGRWFAVGLVMSLVHLAIWLGVGLPYWKLLGWW